MAEQSLMALAARLQARYRAKRAQWSTERRQDLRLTALEQFQRRLEQGQAVTPLVSQSLAEQVSQAVRDALPAILAETQAQTQAVQRVETQQAALQSPGQASAHQQVAMALAAQEPPQEAVARPLGVVDQGPPQAGLEGPLTAALAVVLPLALERVAPLLVAQTGAVVATALERALVTSLVQAEELPPHPTPSLEAPQGAAWWQERAQPEWVLEELRRLLAWHWAALQRVVRGPPQAEPPQGQLLEFPQAQAPVAARAEEAS